MLIFITFSKPPTGKTFLVDLAHGILQEEMVGYFEAEKNTGSTRINIIPSTNC